MKHSIITTFVFALIFITQSVFAETALEEILRKETQRTETIEKTLRSVIAIFPAGGDGPVGGGSGVVISPDGYALTNFHVVQPCGIAMKCGMSDGKAYNAILVGMDPTGDIALIKLLGRDDFPYAPLGDSDLVRIGEEALVMGNPFMLAIDYSPCVSYGMISGVHRYQYPAGTFLEYTDCLQTDAAVNPGNSGGPLFNIHGEIIGINGRCSFEKRGRINVGIGYAVSSNQVRYFLGDLKSGRIVDHANLNAILVTDRIGRVIVDDILPSSDLYRCGVRVDDEMVRFANRSLDTANTFQNILGVFPRDWQVPITVRTPQGTRHDLLVRLGGLHSEEKLIEMTEEMMEPPIPVMPPKEPGQEAEESNRVHFTQAEQPPNERPQAPPGMRQIVMKKKEMYIPDWAKPVYEKRKGYANYYFNRLELSRVLGKWRGENPSKEPWSFTGHVSAQVPFTLTVDDEHVTLRHGGPGSRWAANDPLDVESKIDPISFYQEPVGSGGLFGAFFICRQLLVNEKLDFGEVHYRGTAPLDGDFEKLYDVVSVVWRAVRARLYFDPETAALCQIEYYSMEDRFPCEVRFRQNTACGENQKTAYFPGEIIVHNGTTPFALFQVNAFTPGFSASLPLERIVNATVKEKPNENAEESATENKTRFSEEALSVGVVSELKRKIVKIYGSGGLAGMHGYQTGCLISPQGHILTVSGATLEADPLVVILDNGRRFEAELLAADPMMELAILKIDAEELPYFDLKNDCSALVSAHENSLSDLHGFGDTILPGDRIVAVSNPFNIATGNEPASFQQGVLAARTSLRARRGAFATTYKGPVFVVDAITNNPGAKGGAVVLRDSGQFLGLIGKELKNSENNTWLNFVLPGKEVYEKTRTLLLQENASGKRPSLIALDEKPQLEPLPKEAERMMRSWGVILVSNVAGRTPPFVDSVRKGSEAEKLGVRPDDLIVMINNRLTPSRSAVEQQLLGAEADSEILVTLERNTELHEIRLRKK